VNDDETLRKLRGRYSEPLALGKVATTAQELENTAAIKAMREVGKLLTESQAMKAMLAYGQALNGSAAVKAAMQANEVLKASTPMMAMLDTTRAIVKSAQMKEMVKGLQFASASAVAAQLNIERLLDPTGSLRKMRERDREFGKLVNAAMHGSLGGIHHSHFNSAAWKRALRTELRSQLRGEIFVGSALEPDVVSATEPEAERGSGIVVCTNAVVQYVAAGAKVTEAILANPEEVIGLTPKAMVEFVCDRLTAMGVNVGLPQESIFRSDGGVDVFFWPRSGPKYVGIAQIKGHRNSKKEGPSDVQRLGGVLASHKSFDFGYFISNREFTADAIHYARSTGLRLRGPTDLARWAADNFDDDAEYQHLPEEIELTSKVSLPLRRIVGGKR
jgi:hypothetical protein